MARPFKGKISLDIRDADTSCAAWSPYGGHIEMPTRDRLARNGLTYSHWPTTSVCSRR
jgi:arylsulfatase A-like enzyme